MAKKKEKPSIQEGASNTNDSNSKPASVLSSSISKLSSEKLEMIEMIAVGFELVILFNHMLAIYLTQTTIHRTRPQLLPEWFGPAVCVSSTILAKYIVCRCFRKTEYRLLQSMIANKNFSPMFTVKTMSRLMVSICVIFLFFGGLINMSYYFSYRTMIIWTFPDIVSMIVFNKLFPPIPDLMEFDTTYQQHTMTTGGNNKTNQNIGGSKKSQNQSKQKQQMLPSTGVLSSEFASICLAYVAFRVGEGIFFTSVLPIILIEDHYMVFDSTTCSLIAGYVATSTTILLTASTLFLNRAQLVEECAAVGYWIDKGNAIDFDGFDVTEWTSEHSFTLKTPLNNLSSSSANMISITGTGGGGGGGVSLSGSTQSLMSGYPCGSLVSYQERVWESCGSGVSRSVPGDYLSWLSYIVLSQEVGHLKKSKIFFGCSVANLCLLSIQILIIFSAKLTWIPFAQLLTGSLSGMVLMITTIKVSEKLSQPDDKKQ